MTSQIPPFLRDDDNGVSVLLKICAHTDILMDGKLNVNRTGGQPMVGDRLGNAPARICGSQWQAQDNQGTNPNPVSVLDSHW